MYKKYFEKDGKKYGPYFYENKRVGQKVVTNYLGKSNKSSNETSPSGKLSLGKSKNINKRNRILLGLYILVSIVGVLFILDIALQLSPTGWVLFNLEPRYVEGERLGGLIDLNLNGGELIPESSLVYVSLGEQKKVFSLTELVQEKTIEGNFYARNSYINGEGYGYGLIGEKNTYPEISFQLLISTGSETSPETQAGSEDNTQSNVQDSENANENTQEQTTPEATQEQNVNEQTNERTNEQIQEVSETNEETQTNSEQTETSTPASSSETSSPEVSSDFSETVSLTGGVVEGGDFTIDGKVSVGSNFEYNLGENQNARIVEGSVKVNGESVSDNLITLNFENGKAVVSTDYFTQERGFGEDFLTDDIKTIDINIKNLNLSAENGTLGVELVYQDNIITSAEKKIITLPSSENQTQLQNQTNKSLSLTKEIPTLRIKKGESMTLNLSEYFENANEYGFNVENITGVIDGNILTLSADGEFIGAKRASILAYAENQVLESNTFFVLVSSGKINVSISRSQVKLGEDVKWTQNITLESSEDVVVELPASAENIDVKKINPDGNLQEVDYGAKKITENGEEIIQNTNNDGNIKDDSNSFLTGNVVTDIRLVKKTSVFTIILKKIFGMTGLAVDTTIDLNQNKNISIEVSIPSENLDSLSYVVEYTTPAPTSSETEMNYGKQVVVSADSSLNYTDVLSFTNINEVYKVGEENKIKIYWVENKSYVSFDAYDMDGNDMLDYVEWITPHLSNQTFEIILITKAEHLDSERNFIEDVYESVKALDGNTITIPSGDYLRVTFERNLTLGKDMTIYASGEGSVGVFNENANEQIGLFEINNSEIQEYKIYPNYTNSDVYDLLFLGDISVDYVVDPWNATNNSITACGEIAEAGTYTLQNNVSTTGTCFNITADNVVLDLNGKNVTGDNDGVDYGVYASGRNNITIKNGLIEWFGKTANNGYGVYFVSVTNSTIINLTTSNNGYGIYIVSSSSNNFSTTSASSNWVGIYLASSSNNNCYNTNLTLNSWAGFYLDSSSNSNNFYTISALNNNKGIYLASSSNNNNFSTISASNNGEGIYLVSSSNNNFYTISASNNNVAIYLSSGSNNHFYNTTSTSSLQTGVYLGSSSNNSFYNTAVISTFQFFGIYLDSSSNNNNFYNTTSISNNGYGIYLQSSSSNNFNNFESYSNTNQEIASNNWSSSTGNILTYNNTFGEIKLTALTVDVEGTVRFGSGYNIQIGNNSAFLNSSSDISELNVSANITLYGLRTNMGLPRIMRDGVNVCNATTSPACYNFTSLNAGTVVFNVTSWSNYSIVENPYALTTCKTSGWVAGQTYTLQNNVSATETCFNITADNVVLDLNGKNVTGDNSGADYGVYANGRTNITLKNGRIEWFGKASNGFGVYFVSVTNSTIINLTTSNNKYGIYLSSSSNSNNFYNTTSTSNNGYGIVLWLSSSNNFYTTSTPNTVNGIYLNSSSSNNFYNTTSTSNNGFGIVLGLSSNNNNFYTTSTSNNGWGIALSSSQYNNFYNTTSNSSSFDGIFLSSSSNNNNFYTTSTSNNARGIYLSSSPSNNFNNLESYSNTNQEIASNNWGSSTGNILTYNNTFGEIKLTALTADVEGTLRFGSGYNIQIGNNSAFLNSSSDISELNVSANVTLNLVGWGIINPLINKDGVACSAPNCNVLNYNSTTGIIVFNVSSWSNYSIAENPYALNTCKTSGWVAGQTYTLQNNVSATETCFNITANNVVLDLNGKNITGDNDGGDYGVYASGRNNITIKNGRVEWFGKATLDGVGVYFVSATNSTITNLTTSNNMYGIILSESSSNNIYTTSSSNNNDGIDLVSSSSNNFYNTTSTSNNNGIYLFLSSNSNNFYNTTSTSNNNGIRLSSSSFNNFYNTTSTLNNDKGILLVSSSSNNFYNTTSTSNNNEGIDLVSSSSNNFSATTTSSNDNGIYLSSSSSNNFYNTTSTSNNNNGIYLSSSSSNNFYTTTTSNSVTGIFLFSSSNGNNFSATTTSNNNNGIELSSSSNSNNFYNTTSTSNNNNGIYLSSSSSNNFYTTSNSNNSAGISLSSSSSNNFNNLEIYSNTNQEIASGNWGLSTGNVLTYNNTFGEIKFRALSADVEGTLRFGDSSSIRVGNNSAFVNVSGDLSELNVSANITFYGAEAYRGQYPVSLLGIAMDGKRCNAPICNNLTSLNSGVMIINVSNFGAGTISVGRAPRNKFNVSLSSGWNMISLELTSNETGDRNISLSYGWNMIGVSTDNLISHDSLKFTNSSGNESSISIAASSGLLQKQLGYYDLDNRSNTKRYKYSPKDNSELVKGKAYWVYVNDPAGGTLTIPGAGGNNQSEGFAWNNLLFMNDSSSEVKNITNAINSSWISSAIYWWGDPDQIGENTWNIVQPSQYFNSWIGYFTYNNVNNITLLRES